MLISALTQGAQWWSLFFRLACSVVHSGGRNTANKYHWCVFTVIQPHWVCPCSWRVCFPSLHCWDFRLLSWELSDAGPGLHALPRCKPLRFRFSVSPQRCRLGWACVLRPCQVQAAQVTRSLAHIVSPSWRLWLPPPWSQLLGFLSVQWACLLSSGKLISGYNPPGGCWPSKIPRNLG